VDQADLASQVEEHRPGVGPVPVADQGGTQLPGDGPASFGFPETPNWQLTAAPPLCLLK